MLEVTFTPAGPMLAIGVEPGVAWEKERDQKTSHNSRDDSWLEVHLSREKSVSGGCKEGGGANEGHTQTPPQHHLAVK